MLCFLSLISCKKEELPDISGTFTACELLPQGEKCVEGTNAGADETCEVTNILSPWTLQFPIRGSGDNKLTLKNTEALRTMARDGNTRPLRNEIRCLYETSNVNILRRGHKSDINRIGFASQLLVENWIIAMYHPNNYPDHFIVYNVDTKQCFRLDHSDEYIYLEGSGD